MRRGLVYLSSPSSYYSPSICLGVVSGSLHASVLVVLMPYLSSLLQILARLVAGAGGGASAVSRGGVGGLDWSLPYFK